MLAAGCRSTPGELELKSLPELKAMAAYWAAKVEGDELGMQRAMMAGNAASTAAHRRRRIGLDIDTVNTYASKFTIFGWFVGLAYYNWFASAPPHVPLWLHAVLVIAGMFVASIFIGGGVALLMGLLTKIFTNRVDGSPHAFAWGAFISPVLAFFAAKYALELAAWD